MLNQLHAPAHIVSTDEDLSGLEALGSTLNVLLANLFLIYFKTKSYQWHLSGPSRWDYDLLLENQSTEIIACMDAVAGHLQALGLPALHPLEDVAQQRIRRGKAAGPVDVPAMLRDLLADKYDLVKILEIAQALSGQFEGGTTSLPIGKWITTTERHIWSLLKMLEPGLPAPSSPSNRF